MLCMQLSYYELFLQIVEEITGNLDAKKVCKDALKIHSKYLSKVGYILAYYFCVICLPLSEDIYIIGKRKKKLKMLRTK